MMTTTPNVRTTAGAAMVLIAALASLIFADTVFAAPAARGALAGKVFDRQSEALIPDVSIGAYALTSGEEFRVTTDANGTYRVENAPTSVYSFSLAAGGTDYVVQERLDVRVGMPFLLESCFALDTEARTAHVLDECDSGLVEEVRVATIGPHRFLKPQDIPAQLPEPSTTDPDADLLGSPERDAPELLDPAGQDSDVSSDSSMAMPETIFHDELQCLTYEHFPLVGANIPPGDMIQISRVYFRSDKYPDFYYVDMGPENPTIDDFQAILPKPSPETDRIYYYVESVDTNFDSLQTPEFDPEVLEVQDCRDRGATWFDGDEPGIIVGATQGGVAAIPPGFQAAGITGFVSSLGVLTSVGGAAAAGGGVASSTGLVLVVAGGTAAAAGTTVVVTGDEASPPE